MKDLLDDDGKAVTQILALSPDDTEGAGKMVARVSREFGAPPGFPLLADPGHKVIDRYGLLNPEKFREYTVPHPAVFVIDRTGNVTWRYANINARFRPANQDILEALKEMERK